MTPRLARRFAAGSALTLLALTAVACSAASDDAQSAGDTSVAASAPQAEGGGSDAFGGLSADAPAEDVAADSVAASQSYSSAERSLADLDERVGEKEQAGAAPDASTAPISGRSLIKTGAVALRADDVGQARFDVQKIVDAHRGEIAEENTEADDEGKAERSRLVVRVPVAEYTEVIQGLEDVADLISTSSSVEDVSTQVIDTGVRVQLQRRSIDRISLLLDRASSIRDIVNIERELSRREADLGSLEKRQTFLRDQSQQATITVSIERPREEKEPVEKKDEDDEGFLSGLENGWDALAEVTTGLLTASGALLPFALVLLVIGLPARAVWRRRRPMAPAGPAAAQSNG